GIYTYSGAEVYLGDYDNEGQAGSDDKAFQWLFERNYNGCTTDCDDYLGIWARVGSPVTWMTLEVSSARGDIKETNVVVRKNECSWYPFYGWWCDPKKRYQ